MIRKAVVAVLISSAFMVAGGCSSIEPWVSPYERFWREKLLANVAPRT